MHGTILYLMRIASSPCDSLLSSTRAPAQVPPDPVYLKSQPHRDQMTRLDVICPAAPWENDTTDADRAWDLCFNLSEEYGYAQVRQNGVIIGEYTNGR